MPTLLNQGTLLFTPEGGTQSTALSNVTSTTVNVSYGLSVAHGASPETFVVGDVITYSTVLTNTGSGTLNDVQIAVDLGNGALDYATGSAQAFVYNGTDIVAYPVTVEQQGSGLVFLFSDPLPGGSSVYLTYQAIVNATAGETVVSTATGSATDAGGTTLSDSDTATITRRLLSIVKSAPETASVGDTISYQFAITNTSAGAVSLDTLTDQLPLNFSFTGLTLTINSVNVPLVENVDYTVSPTGELVLSPTGAVAIPAGGIALLTVTGVITS